MLGDFALVPAGQEGPRSVLCRVLLPAVEAQQLWGQALLLRSLGAQRLKAACVCPRHRLNSSLLKNLFASCYGAV